MQRRLLSIHKIFLLALGAWCVWTVSCANQNGDGTSDLLANQPIQSTPPPVPVPPPVPTPVVGQLEIDMTNELTFDPPLIQVNVGDTVRWTNTTHLVHTVTVGPEFANDPDYVALPDEAEPFNSGAVHPGQVFAHTFTEPGEYRYFCIPHQDRGMRGTIIVAP